MDPMGMDDDEYRSYQARERASRVYHHEGFGDFAKRVELGLEDGCSQVRLARFFVDPTPPASAEFVAAWNVASTAKNRP